MRSRLPLAGLTTTPAFARAYIESYPQVAPWFDYDPHAAGSFAARLTELDGRAWPDLAPSAELAARQQEAWGGGAAAIEAARSLGQPQTYMVVTGQQPGLFGGPLYTQLKALSAVLLARKLAAEFPGRRFVPVFWIASADSDFDEVSHTTVWTGMDYARSFSLSLERELDGMTLKRRSVPREGLIELLADVADDTYGLYREDVLGALQAAYTPTGLADAGRLVNGFARWLALLFSGTGLVIIDPEEMLAARPDVGTIYAAELRASEEAEETVRSRDAELRSAGFTPQVELAPGDTQVFHIDEQGYRDKLLRDSDSYLIGKRSGTRWSVADASSLAEAQPGRFTSSVLLRPLVEEALFPCAAWIGGTAELAYRAQATALFTMHGRKHAPAFLRHHATLLTSKLTEALKQSGHELSSVPRDMEDWRRVLAQHKTSTELQSLMDEYRSGALLADSAAERLPELLPELERSMRTMRGKLAWHLQRVERKVRGALLRRSVTEVAQLTQLHELAYPKGKPQDRLLNLLSFLPRTGFGLIPRLLGDLEMPCWEHCLIMFD